MKFAIIVGVLLAAIAFFLYRKEGIVIQVGNRPIPLPAPGNPGLPKGGLSRTYQLGEVLDPVDQATVKTYAKSQGVPDWFIEGDFKYGPDKWDTLAQKATLDFIKAAAV